MDLIAGLSVGNVIEILVLIGSLVYFKAKTETRLDNILEQTTKTNGRLVKVEDKLQNHGERLAGLEAELK